MDGQGCWLHGVYLTRNGPPVKLGVEPLRLALNWVEGPAAHLYIVDIIDLIQQKRGELTRLCRQFKVDRLDLFGSAATGNFNPSSSDLDFVIEFEDRSASGLLNRYLDFAEALERLFGRHVDLLTPRSIRNPYFRQAIDSTKETLYERGIQTTHP